MRTIWLILCVMVMLVGVAGTVIPGVPGMPLVLLGVVIFAVAAGLAAVGWEFILLVVALTLLTLVLDYLAVALGAGTARASGLGLTGAAVGAIIGVILGGVPGLLVGAPVGAVLGEVTSGRTLRQGVKVALATVIGLAVTAVLKFGIGVGVVIMFLIRVT